MHSYFLYSIYDSTSKIPSTNGVSLEHNINEIKGIDVHDDYLYVSSLLYIYSITSFFFTPIPGGSLIIVSEE